MENQRVIQRILEAWLRIRTLKLRLFLIKECYSLCRSQCSSFCHQNFNLIWLSLYELNKWSHHSATQEVKLFKSTHFVKHIWIMFALFLSPCIFTLWWVCPTELLFVPSPGVQGMWCQFLWILKNFKDFLVPPTILPFSAQLQFPMVLWCILF